MLLLILCVIVLTCIVSILFKVVKGKKINIKNKKIIVILITIVILIGFGFCGVKIYQQLPHNEVSKDDRIVLESYILDNYGLELKVKESTVIHRGNIGVNPGIEYIFILQNDMGFEYHLDINRYAEMDLRTILAENPELDLVKMK